MQNVFRMGRLWLLLEFDQGEEVYVPVYIGSKRNARRALQYANMTNSRRARRWDMPYHFRPFEKMYTEVLDGWYDKTLYVFGDGSWNRIRRSSGANATIDSLVL